MYLSQDDRSIQPLQPVAPEGYYANNVGVQNPKTFTPPVISARSHDLEEWNPYGVRSDINTSKLTYTLPTENNITHFNIKPEYNIRSDRELAAKALLTRKLNDSGGSEEGRDIHHPPIAENFVDAGVGDKTRLLKMRDRGVGSPQEIVYPMYRGSGTQEYGPMMPHHDNNYSQYNGVYSSDDLKAVGNYYGINGSSGSAGNHSGSAGNHSGSAGELGSNTPPNEDGVVSSNVSMTIPPTDDEVIPSKGYPAVASFSAREKAYIPAYRHQMDSDSFEVNKPTPIERIDPNHLAPNSYHDVPRFYYNKYDDCKNGHPDFRGKEMPSNLNVSNLEIDERFAGTNRELYTQTIQPGVYSTHKYSEPINSNLGISHTPQFQPLAVTKSPQGEYYYNRIDPQLLRDNVPTRRLNENPKRSGWSNSLPAQPTDPGTVSLENIYDPRHTGHGDPYRSYFDITTGQWRYYYGDVDAYKKPNFISRTNVDHIDFMTPQGSVLPEYHRRIGAANYQGIAENAFHDNAILHRESIMESLMRKRNSEAWQQRAFPIRKNAVTTCAYK
jgi:hypothetical protein